MKAFGTEEIRQCMLTLKDEIVDLSGMLSDSELERITETASRIPPATSADDHLVDIGGTVMWLPIYRQLLGYRRISLVQFPNHLDWDRYAGRFGQERLRRDFGCEFVPANIDVSTYSIASRSASCVLCFEVLEHLQGDPMQLIQEANRILRDGGVFYLSTPNVLYAQNLVRFLFGDHPYSWATYTSSYGDRHNREYTAFELRDLMTAGGFSVDALETLTFHSRVSGLRRLAGQALCLVPAMLGKVPFAMRGAFCHVRARQTGPVKSRYPSWLYDMYGSDRVSRLSTAGTP